MQTGGMYFAGLALMFAPIGCTMESDELPGVLDSSEHRAPFVEEAEAETGVSDTDDVSWNEDDGAVTEAEEGSYSPTTNTVFSPDGGARLKYWTTANKFDLTDKKCDSHPVYANYRISGGREQRQNLDSGCNRSISWLVQGNARHITYRVCTNIQRGRDRCSGWVIDDM